LDGPATEQVWTGENPVGGMTHWRKEGRGGVCAVHRARSDPRPAVPVESGPGVAPGRRTRSRDLGDHTTGAIVARAQPSRGGWDAPQCDVAAPAGGAACP